MDAVIEMTEDQRRQAEQERYDLETLDRYQVLVARFENHSWGQLGHGPSFRQLRRAAEMDLPMLYSKEGR